MSGLAKYEHINFSPPDGVRSEAAKGLEWRQEHNRGGTEVGVARARDLSNGRDISPETARRMASYFARHAVDKQGQGWSPGEDGFPSAGRIAWALWGGDAGEAWSSKLTKQMNSADKPQAKSIMKEIRIDGVIGQGKDEVSAAELQKQLPTTGEPIRVSIHSEGGSVFEGFAMHDVLAKYPGPKTIAVESTAFSIASFIAMAGDEIEMSPNAYFMLHNPRINIEGDDEELGKNAKMIADLKNNMVNAYAQRTGKSEEEIQSVLKAETYFNATDAVAFGLADRITQKPVKGRVIARIESLPHGVATALFGVGSGGDNDSKKGQKMTESKPVAATVKEIKAAFPALAKAKPSFVIDCIEREMPLASVASAAAEEMMKENEELKAKVSALEEEMAKAKAKAESDEEKPDAKAEGEDMEDDKKKEDSEAKARARGAKPVAKGTSGKPSASARWKDLIQAKVVAGIPRAQAIMAVDVENPGLRSQYLEEVNAR